MNATALNPSIELTNGKLTTTSKAVAEFFGKLHKNVIRAIEGLKADIAAEYHKLNFEPMIVSVDIGKGALDKTQPI